MTTGKININIIDNAQKVASPQTGVVFVMGETKMGPVNDPSTIISSWKQFQSIFGGLDGINNLFPLYCKNMLEQGALLRVCRLVHYTDITDPDSITAGFADKSGHLTVSFNKPLVATKTIVGSKDGGNTWLDVGAYNATLATQWANFISGCRSKFTDRVDQLGSGGIFPSFPAGDFSSLMSQYPDITNVQQTVWLFPLLGLATGDMGLSFQVGTGTIAGGNFVQDATYEVIVDSDPSIYSMFGNKICDVVSKAPGSAYELVYIRVSSPYYNTGLITTVNITAGILVDGSLVTETATGISFPWYLDNGVFKSLVNEAFWSSLNSKFQYIRFIPGPLYEAPGTIQGPMIPAINPNDLSDTYAYSLLTGGVDGSPLTDTDYTGDRDNKFGFYAFDDYEDSYVMVFNYNDNSIIEDVALPFAQYLDSRIDLGGIIHIPISNNTSASSLITTKNSWNTVSKNIIFTSGGVKIQEPSMGALVEAHESFFAAIQMVKTHKNNGPWYSFAGPNYGVFTGVYGVVNNFGTSARRADLELLAAAKINMAIYKNSQFMLWDDYTAYNIDSPQKFASIMNLLRYIVKGMGPTLESFLGKPTDFELLKGVYHTCKPFMENLVAKRALFSYEWNGDQEAESFGALKINTPEDLQDGKVVIQLKIVTIAPLKEITLNIELTKAGVSVS